MAKFHADRIKQKYGWKTGKYQTLISQILEVNTGNISRAIGRISKDNYARSLRSIKRGTQRVILPDVSEVLPKRSVFILKGAERGKLLSDEIRDLITKDLRSVIQPGFIRRTGPMAGTVQPKAIQELEKKLTKTFTNYTKRDPSYGVPSNIHNIAVTEVRINADQIRHEYTQKLVEKNRDNIRVVKYVRKNNNLVKEPRENHEELARRTQRRPVPFDQNFVLIGKDGREYHIPHMHHKSLPPGEVISCACEVEYKVVVL